MDKLTAQTIKMLLPIKKFVFKNMTDEQLQLLAQIVRFGCVGVINTIVSYVVVVLCVYFGMYILLGNAIAFIVSTACAFVLNYFFVFSPRPCWWRGLIKAYCSYAFTGIGLNSALLYLLSDVLNVSEYISPLLALVVTIPCNFLLNKFWAFKK